MSLIDLFSCRSANRKANRNYRKTTSIVKLVIDQSYGEYRFYDVVSPHTLVMTSCSPVDISRSLRILG